MDGFEQALNDAYAEGRKDEREALRATKLWLWRNHVDGRPEYWAFDNPYPFNLHNGDPQTLGEPCGYAVFKPSRDGSNGRTEEQVLRAISRAGEVNVMSFPKNCAVCGGAWSINHNCQAYEGRDGDKYKERQQELSPERAIALENALSQELARQGRIHESSRNRGVVSGWSDATVAVLSERNTQRKRYGDQHDDEHGPNVLALQACGYLMPGQSPQKSEWAHKSKVVDRDPRRVQLIKGVALALAALEAHDRAEKRALTALSS